MAALLGSADCPELAGKSRDADDIRDALTVILEKFKPTECSNYIRHSGFVQM